MRSECIPPPNIPLHPIREWNKHGGCTTVETRTRGYGVCMGVVYVSMGTVGANPTRVLPYYLLFAECIARVKGCWRDSDNNEPRDNPCQQATVCWVNCES